MKVKGPVGECQYCGQEFMTRQGLNKHEAEHCTERLKAEPEPVQQRWRQVVQGGRAIGWARR